MVAGAYQDADRMLRSVWVMPDEGGGMPPADFATPKE